MAPTTALSVAGAQIVLPRLSANEASARSLIARHGADLTLRLAPLPAAGPDSAASVWQLRFTAGVMPAVRDAASIHARVEWAGARLSVALPEVACRTWLQTHGPGLDLDPLPLPLAAAAVETMLANVLAALDAVSGSGPAKVLGVGTDEAGCTDLPHAWSLTVRSHSTGQSFFCTLHTDGLGLMLLAGALSSLPATNNDLDLDSVPVAVCAFVGRTVLSAAELRCLQLHDVVLLDQYLVDSQGELWLTVCGGQSLRIRQEQSSFIVTQGWTTIMNLNPDQRVESDPQSADTGLLDVDAIPVRLTFDLGERLLTLGELRRLQPGETFDLHRPLADGPVMVRANGALIGTGELVEIDGRIGVALSTLGKVNA
nr:type III secretion system cytoplasmic ring protein SctQ [Pseudomonas sp.]